MFNAFKINGLYRAQVRTIKAENIARLAVLMNANMEMIGWGASVVWSNEPDTEGRVSVYVEAEAERFVYRAQGYLVCWFDFSPEGVALSK